jgi:hypothetical protein
MEERKSKLYKLVNGIGIYWVIAKDPTDAENKLMGLLDKADYGFSKDRVVKEIHLIADEIYEGSSGISNKFLVV